MFASRHEFDCLTERARLCLLSVRDMYGDYLLNFGYTSSTAREFMNAMHGLFGQARSQLINRTEYNSLIASSSSR